MKPAVRAAYRAAVAAYTAARRARDFDSAFAALERAHVLGQRFLFAHIITHLRMFRVGWARRDLREMTGQFIRLIATIPGYLSGWVPRGNSGGANVSAIKPMPLAPDLEPLLQDFQVWRAVAWRAALYSIALLAAFLALAVIETRRADAADSANSVAVWATLISWPSSDSVTPGEIRATPFPRSPLSWP